MDKKKEQPLEKPNGIDIHHPDKREGSSKPKSIVPEPDSNEPDEPTGNE